MTFIVNYMLLANIYLYILGRRLLANQACAFSRNDKNTNKDYERKETRSSRGNIRNSKQDVFKPVYTSTKVAPIMNR